MSDTPAQKSSLTVNVYGKFSLRDEHGVDFTPQSMKARGMLVLLINSPNFERSKSWLQSKLWSDRSQAQASSSFRRTLSDIRKALGPHRSILKTNNSTASLDTNKIVINRCKNPNLKGSFIEEAFEGVDINDAEFENILRELRTSAEKSTSTFVQNTNTTTKPSSQEFKHVIVLDNKTYSNNMLPQIAAQIFTDRLIRYLGEIDQFEILQSDNTLLQIHENSSSSKIQILKVEIHTSISHSDVFLGCKIIHPRSCQVHWSSSTWLSENPRSFNEDFSLGKLVHQTVQELCTSFSRESGANDHQFYSYLYTERAKKLNYKLSKESLLSAEELLIKAHEHAPIGKNLIWRAFIRHTARNQHVVKPLFENNNSSNALLTAAFQLAPTDPATRAIYSQLELFNQGDCEVALEMALLAYEANPFSPLNCALVSNALMLNQRLSEGYQAAQKAVELSKQDENHFYFHHFACMAAAGIGEYDKARYHANLGLSLRPDFVSLRRYQIALAFQNKDEQHILYSTKQLQLSEPNFTPLALLDPSYPVPTLRRIPLIDLIK